MNRHFKRIYGYHKEDTQITHKHMKRCLRILISRGIQINTKKRNYFMPIRMTAIKRQKITSVGKDVVKLELLCAIDRNVRRYSHCGKQMMFPTKIQNIISI